jgi:hypothetical protein
VVDVVKVLNKLRDEQNFKFLKFHLKSFAIKKFRSLLTPQLLSYYCFKR